ARLEPVADRRMAAEDRRDHCRDRSAGLGVRGRRVELWRRRGAGIRSSPHRRIADWPRAAHPLVQPVRSAAGLARDDPPQGGGGILLLPAFLHGARAGKRHAETGGSLFRRLHAGARHLPVVPFRGPAARRRRGGMSAGEEILARLAARRRIGHRVVVVAAHPDDETIGLGAQLQRLDDALLVHVTDGAPRDGHDAAVYGFATLADYEAARRRELAAALTKGGADHLRTLSLGIVDQEAMHHLPSLARQLRERFLQERPQAVVTHA